MARLYPLIRSSVLGIVFLGRFLGPAIVTATAVCGLVCHVDASQKQADSPNQPGLLRLLRESRQDYNNVAVSFVQNKSLAIVEITLKSEGMIFFRRPGSVRYEIDSPIRSLLLYDGKKVRSYAFSEGKWSLQRNPQATAVGQVLRQIGRWIQGDFAADRKMFKVDVLPWEEGEGLIRLTPRSEALGRFVQWIDLHVVKAPDYRVTRVTIRESDVDVTELRFCRELHDIKLPEGTFVSPDASGACRVLLPREDRCDPNEIEKSRS